MKETILAGYTYEFTYKYCINNVVFCEVFLQESIKKSFLVQTQAKNIHSMNKDMRFRKGDVGTEWVIQEF